MTKRYGKNKRGFTLMELLVVIAIIVVLVAISIPIFTKQLEKSREATDLANMRAAKAAAVTEYLTSDGSTTAEPTTTNYYYDAEAGVLKTAATGIAGYGKGTATVGSESNRNTAFSYTASSAVKDQILKVNVTSDGTVSGEWVAAGN